MKQVLQEDSTGCGLACVAMITGKRYKAIKKLAVEILPDWPNGPRSFYTNAIHLKALLNASAVSFGNYRQAQDWSQIKAGLSIAAINMTKNRNWHWVIFCQHASDAYILDPRAKQAQRRDFSRARLHAYLPIRSVEQAHINVNKKP